MVAVELGWLEQYGGDVGVEPPVRETGERDGTGVATWSFSPSVRWPCGEGIGTAGCVRIVPVAVAHAKDLPFPGIDRASS